MLIILHDHYAGPEKLSEQLAELRLLPWAERVAIVSKSQDTARLLGLEWLPEPQTNGFYRLMKLTAGQPVLKINDTQVMSHSTLAALWDSHQKSQKPISVFCPGPNDFIYSPTVLAELYDPARLETQKGRQKISASLKIRVRNLVKANVGLLQKTLSPQTYQKLRKKYWRWRDSAQISGGRDQIVMPEIDLETAALDRQVINVFTGGPGDKVVYLVERLQEFYAFPSVIHYVLSNLCNLRCVMCPYHSETARAHRQSSFFNHPNYTKVEHFRRVAQEAGKYGAHIRFGQLEEALLHKDISEFIRLARQAGVADVHLTTNGMLLTHEMGERLLEAGLSSLMVSIDAHSQQTYDQIRLHGDFAKVVKHTQKFIKLRDKKRTRTNISVSLILQERALEEKDDFITFWRDQGIDEVTIYQLSEYNANGHIKLTEGYYDQSAYRRYPCAAPWVEAFVFPTGDVSLCCYTLELVPTKGILTVGNVGDKLLSEIWSDEAYQLVRKQLIHNHFSDDITRNCCLNCQIWSSSTKFKRFLPDSSTLYYNETMATYQFS